MGVSAVIGSAVIGAGVSTYQGSKQRSAARDQFQFANFQSAQGAYAQADSAIKASEAEAEAILAQADIQEDAIVSQADLEKKLLFKQADDQRAIANQNISTMQMEATEGLRRLSMGHRGVEGVAKVKAGASGVRQDIGSTRDVISSLQNENTRQYNWQARAYKSGIDVYRNTSTMAYNNTRRQGEAAVEAAGYQVKALQETAGVVASTTKLLGQYSAEALRLTGDSYLGGGRGSYPPGTRPAKDPMAGVDDYSNPKKPKTDAGR